MPLVDDVPMIVRTWEPEIVTAAGSFTVKLEIAALKSRTVFCWVAPVAEKTTSATGASERPVISPPAWGDQFPPDQVLLAPPVQWLSVALAGAAPWITFVSIVTAPSIASTLPSRWTPLLTVTLVVAMRFPWNVLPTPSVADVPIAQKTLVELPFKNVTWELTAVVRVVPMIKWKTAFGS